MDSFDCICMDRIVDTLVCKLGKDITIGEFLNYMTKDLLKSWLHEGSGARRAVSDLMRGMMRLIRI
jgi:hypothetical protein